MKEFYLVGIKVDGKLISVSPEEVTLEKASEIGRSLNTVHTKYVAIKCEEVE